MRNKDASHKLKPSRGRQKNMSNKIFLSLSILNALKIKQRNRRISTLWILREIGGIKVMRKKERQNQKVQWNINQSIIYLLDVPFIVRINCRLYHHRRDRFIKILSIEIENMRNIIYCRHLINRKNQKRVWSIKYRWKHLISMAIIDSHYFTLYLISSPINRVQYYF